MADSTLGPISEQEVPAGMGRQCGLKRKLQEVFLIERVEKLQRCAFEQQQFLAVRTTLVRDQHHQRMHARTLACSRAFGGRVFG